MKTIPVILTLLLLCGAMRAPAQPILYPGDTNNDGVCNYLDLIPISVAYGAVGPSRQIPGFNWAPTPYNPWDGFLPQSEINLAFANTNSLGPFFAADPPPFDTIDFNDILAIAANYESVQGVPPADPPPFPFYLDLLPVVDPGFPRPRITVEFSRDTAGALDTFYAEINFTASPSIFPGAAVVALRLEFDPANFEEHPPRLLFDTVSTDLMSVGATFNEVSFDRSPPAGVAELAVAGYGQNVFLMPRKVAAVEYILDMIIRGPAPDTVYKSFWIEFDTVVLVSNQEELFLPVETHSDTIQLRMIIVDVAPEPDWSAAVRLAPNPANDYAAVETGGDCVLEKATLWDALGRPLWDAHGPAQRLELPLAGLPPGVFWVEIRTDRGRIWRKLAVVR